MRSAGFINPGRRASRKMRLAAAERGLDLDDHRSQLVSTMLLDWADFVVFMDKRNQEHLGQYQGTGIPLGSKASPPVATIRDPVYMKASSPEFSAVVDQIIGASRILHAELIT